MRRGTFLGAVIVMLLFAALPLRAQQALSGEAVDKRYDDCLNNAMTTMAQYQCISAAYNDWDRILNANYQAAMARLSPADQALLRDAQRKWLAYRDADRNFRGGAWATAPDVGTMLGVILADTDLQILKARAQALASYGPDGISEG